MAATRDKLVKQRTALVNKIHNVLNSHGLKFKKKTLTMEKGLRSVVAFDWDTIVRVELEVLADQIRSLSKSIKRLDSDIFEHGKDLKGHSNLRSIKGIGDKSATVLLSVIGDVTDFANEDKLASYFGIVPKVKDSNETVRHGRITKHGSTLARYRDKPYIGEYLDEIDGQWLKPDSDRSRYYNHSTFCDLVINGLVGLIPREDNASLVSPLIPSDKWDWF